LAQSIPDHEERLLWRLQDGGGPGFHLAVTPFLYA